MQKNAGGTYYSKNFLLNPVAYTVAALPFERTRADRYVDKLTRLMLDQLDQGLPANERSVGYAQRQRLWNQIAVPPHYRSQQAMPICRSWVEDYDARIRKLRNAVSLP